MTAIAQSPIFAIILMIGSSSVIVAIITARTQRNSVDATVEKGRAEAGKIISDAALAWNQELHKQIEDLKTALKTHREWDKQVVKKARAAGLEIDDPPELWL